MQTDSVADNFYFVWYHVDLVFSMYCSPYPLPSKEPVWKSVSHVQLFVTPWTDPDPDPDPNPNPNPNPNYTVHVILRARILEWVAFLFSRLSSQPRDQTQVSCIAGFTSWATREARE